MVQKKIRPSVWAVAFLIVAAAFCVYRISSWQWQAPLRVSEDQARAMAKLTRAEIKEMHRKAKEYRQALSFNEDHNYSAKFNNGSKRKGLSPEELPKALRADAIEIAQQYKDAIYPVLKKFIASHEGKLPYGGVPELRPYMVDAKYKGHGEYMYGRGSWSIGVRWRLDGSMVCREIYSKNGPEEPHDVWATNPKYVDVPSQGKGFLICGWDDGVVTFDPVKLCYYTIVHRNIGDEQDIAVPGQAGIPPTATHTLRNWITHRSIKS